MNRRRLLALVGVGAPGGYLAWRWYRTPRLPDGLRVETLYTIRDLRPDRDGSPPREGREYAAVVASGVEAAELALEGEAVSFVEATDFDESYLLLLQTGMQSQPDLELTAIERVDGGLHVRLAVDAPRFGVDDDFTVHSFLIRVTDDRAPPESVTVDVEGYV